MKKKEDVATRISEYDKNISNNLKYYRQGFGLSQQEVANILGVTIQQVQKYERGVNRLSGGKLYMLAKKLNLDIVNFYRDLDYIVEDDLATRVFKSRKVFKAFHAISDDKVRKSLADLITVLSTEKEQTR